MAPRRAGTRVARAESTEVPPAKAFAAPKRSARTLAQFETEVALMQLAGQQRDEFAALMKTVDLTTAQYNVLRILRGAGPGGSTCGDVIERLIHRDPDLTRLLDRLERRGLIARRRDPLDRRAIRTTITAAGLSVLGDLDEPVNALHEQQLGHLSEDQLAQLRRLIELAQARPA
jgi:DNA-binding MarR family transcriptional regulator